MLVKLVSAHESISGFWFSRTRVFLGFANKGGAFMNSVRHGIVTTTLRLTTDIIPFSTREGYYVQEINLSNFFCFGD